MARRRFGPGERRAALLLLAVVSVNASYTVLIPFVPELEDRAGAGPAVIAAAFAVFAAARMLTQPVGGWWVDRWRPGPVACVSLLVCAVGIALTAVARDPSVLLAGRVVWGIGEGLVSPALYAGMSALCTRYDIPVSRMTGNFGMAAVAGFLLGPLVTGVAAPLGVEVLFLAGAGLTAAMACCLLPAVPAVAAAPAPADEGPAAPAAAPTGWWRAVLALGVLDMSTYLVYAGLEPVLPLYLGSTGGDATGAVSAVLAVGLATSGVMLWILGRWTGRVPLTTLVGAGLALVSLGLPGLALSPRLLPVAGWFVVYMTGYSMLFLAARRGVLQLRAAAASQGAAFGLFGMVSDVGNIAGPVLAVLLWHLSGPGVFVVFGATSGALLLGLLAASGRRALGRRRPAGPAAARLAPVEAELAA